MGNKCVPQARPDIVSQPGWGDPTNRAPASVFSVLDGRLKEFKRATTAGEVVKSDDDAFLASSESMEVGLHVPRVPSDEVLQPGQLYFVLPGSFFLSPLSLHDLCDLAVKAGAALGARRGRRGADEAAAKGCYPEVAHMFDRVEKLMLRNGSFGKS
uniref:Uncharacterized protein n=1 Tax=Kalanchoe fedtschenkoi TaxID=63787 RepID=A0A7N0T447_KALFE